MSRFLDDFKARYGGVDCVMLWQSYTNLGVDNQNQIDQLRNMPGGVQGERPCGYIAEYRPFSNFALPKRSLKKNPHSGFIRIRGSGTMPV